MNRRRAAAMLALALVALASCGRSNDDVTPAAAAAALRAETVFTTRAKSPVGRELLQVVVVRRIGRSSCEVEFTWKDTAPPAGQQTAPVRTSMALFRRGDDGSWKLASLYKVN